MWGAVAERHQSDASTLACPHAVPRHTHQSQHTRHITHTDSTHKQLHTTQPTTPTLCLTSTCVPRHEARRFPGSASPTVTPRPALRGGQDAKVEGEREPVEDGNTKQNKRVCVAEQGKNTKQGHTHMSATGNVSDVDDPPTPPTCVNPSHHPLSNPKKPHSTRVHPVPRLPPLHEPPPSPTQTRLSHAHFHSDNSVTIEHVEWVLTQMRQRGSGSEAKRNEEGVGGER